MTYDDALDKVKTICSKQEKCITDIKIKLSALGINADEQEQIVGTLIEEKYIDEYRYSCAFTRDKYRLNKWGRYKIAFALKGKKIASHITDQAMKEINDEEYLNNLKEILLAKASKIVYQNNFERDGKLRNYAMGKGYTNDEISEVLQVINPD